MYQEKKKRKEVHSSWVQISPNGQGTIWRTAEPSKEWKVGNVNNIQLQEEKKKKKNQPSWSFHSQLKPRVVRDKFRVR